MRTGSGQEVRLYAAFVDATNPNQIVSPQPNVTVSFGLSDVSSWAGFAMNQGTLQRVADISTIFGGLRSEGLIDYPAGGTVALTDAGAALASTDGVPTTTDELHEAIRGKLPPAKWKILEALTNAYPKSLHKDALAERIGVSPTSGGFFNNLGSLRSLGLIDYPQPGHAVALPVLFLEEAEWSGRNPAMSFW